MIDFYPSREAPHEAVFISSAEKRDRVAAISTLVCDDTCASGRTSGRHLCRIRAADALEAHLGCKRTTYPMSPFSSQSRTNFDSKRSIGSLFIRGQVPKSISPPRPIWSRASHTGSARRFHKIMSTPRSIETLAERGRPTYTGGGVG